MSENEWVKWVFDGFGTEILSLIFGAISGGLIGFRIGKRKRKFIQVQESGFGSDQYQKGIMASESVSSDKETHDAKSLFYQTQKAGSHSTQIQIGGQDNV